MKIKLKLQMDRTFMKNVFPAREETSPEVSFDSNPNQVNLRIHTKQVQVMKRISTALDPIHAVEQSFDKSMQCEAESPSITQKTNSPQLVDKPPAVSSKRGDSQNFTIRPCDEQLLIGARRKLRGTVGHFKRQLPPGEFSMQVGQGRNREQLFSQPAVVPKLKVNLLQPRKNRQSTADSNMKLLGQAFARREGRSKANSISRKEINVDIPTTNVDSTGHPPSHRLAATTVDFTNLAASQQYSQNTLLAPLESHRQTHRSSRKRNLEDRTIKNILSKIPQDPSQKIMDQVSEVRSMAHTTRFLEAPATKRSRPVLLEQSFQSSHDDHKYSIIAAKRDLFNKDIQRSGIERVMKSHRSSFTTSNFTTSLMNTISPASKDYFPPSVDDKAKVVRPKLQHSIPKFLNNYWSQQMNIAEVDGASTYRNTQSSAFHLAAASTHRAASISKDPMLSSRPVSQEEDFFTLQEGEEFVIENYRITKQEIRDDPPELLQKKQSSSMLSDYFEPHFTSRIKTRNSIIALNQVVEERVYGDENWDKVAEIAYDDLDYETFLRALDGEWYDSNDKKVAQEVLQRRKSDQMAESDVVYAEMILQRPMDFWNYKKAATVKRLPNSEIPTTPYIHLQAKVVLDCRKYSEELTEIDKIIDNHDRIIKLTKLNKAFLTYLDKKKEELLPFELFIEDYLDETQVMADEFQRRKKNNEDPLRAITYFYHLDGRMEKIEAEVIDFVDDEKMFKVQYEPPKGVKAPKQMTKLAGRLNLQFIGFDTEEDNKRRLKCAHKRRRAATIYLGQEMIIVNELVKRYPNIEMPEQLRHRIRKRLRLNVALMDDRELVKNVIVQVESHFVYATLRSVLISQQNDYYIKSLLRKYSLRTLDIPTVDNDGTIFAPYEPPKFDQYRHDQTQLAIKKILTNTIPGTSKFIETLQFAMECTFQVMKYSLFDLPVELSDDSLSYLMLQKKFKHFETKKALKKQLEQYPVEMPQVLAIWDILAKRFKRLLETKWADTIAKRIEKTFGPSEATSLKQISPLHPKFFSFLNTYLETKLFEKMQKSMHKYLRFILNFMIRDTDLVKNPLFSKLGLDEITVKVKRNPLTEIQVKVIRRKCGQTVAKELLGLIKRQSTFFKMNIPRGQGVMDTAEEQFQVSTVPDFIETWDKFKGTINHLQNSLTGIRRIERLVYPLLKVAKDKEFMSHPDLEKVDNLKELSQRILWLLKYAEKEPLRQLKRLQSYMGYISLDIDTIMFNMKMQSYKEQQIQLATQGAEGYEEQSSSSNDGLSVGQESEARDEVDLQGDQLEKVHEMQVSDKVYSEKYTELKEVYWEVLSDIPNECDSGLVRLDLKHAKNLIAQKLEVLLQKVEFNIVSEFVERLDALSSEFESIDTKIHAEHLMVGAIIEQMEFVKHLAANEDVFDNLDRQLEELIAKKDFLDSLRIKVPSESFMKFLRLYPYSCTLRDSVADKILHMAEKKARLQEMLEDDVEEIEKLLALVKEGLDRYKRIGLQTVEQLYASIQKDTPKDIVKLVEELKLDGALPEDIAPNNSYMFSHLNQLKLTDNEVQKIDKQIKELHWRQNKLELDLKHFPQLGDIKLDLYSLRQLWEVAANYLKNRSRWWTEKISKMDSHDLLEQANDWDKVVQQSLKSQIITENEKPNNMLIYIQSELATIVEYIPLIATLRHRALDRRHFSQMSKVLGMTIDPTQLTLEDLKEKNLIQASLFDAIKQVADVAHKEYNIKLALDQVGKEIVETQIDFQVYEKDGKTKIIMDPEDIIQIFEDNLIKCQAMKGNQFATHQAAVITRHEGKLQFMIQAFSDWTRVQKQWLHLQPIYTQQDVIDNLQKEIPKFNEADALFKKTHNSMIYSATCQELCESDNFVKITKELSSIFEHLDKALCEYLDRKRAKFARLFFTSNDELIEMMGQLDNNSYLQGFLGKLFEGVQDLDISTAKEIQAIKGKTGETLKFNKPIKTDKPMEVWLKSMEGSMKEAVYDQLNEGLVGLMKHDQDQQFLSWIKQYPGQVVIVCLHIMLNNSMNRVFSQNQVDADYTLQKLQKETLDSIKLLSREVRKKLDENSRITIYNMLINKIHTRDLVKGMMDEQLEDAEDFYWKIQLKYHYVFHQGPPKEKLSADSVMSPGRRQSVKIMRAAGKVQGLPDEWDCECALSHPWITHEKRETAGAHELSVSCVNARIHYGYEYAGNEQRLVITPLTDKCFRTMFLAVHYGYGGAPEGPVGTGKTETTKELAKSVSRVCFVFNCSSSLNFDQLLKFFKGFASGGGWSCFDEFNRIPLSVLSMVSQIIITINQACRDKRDMISLSGDDLIQFNPSCSIFITMNPFHHGRHQLPDNLKSQFRPVQMVLPDTRIITEVVMYCSGFRMSHELSMKLIRLFEFASKQLGSSVHYDFGLRALKVIVVQASHLKLLCAGAISPISEEIKRATECIQQHILQLKKTFTMDKMREEESKQAEDNELLKTLGIKVKRKTVKVMLENELQLQEERKEESNSSKQQLQRAQTSAHLSKSSLKDLVELEEPKVDKQKQEQDAKSDSYFSETDPDSSDGQEEPLSQKQKEAWKRYQEFLQVKSFKEVNSVRKLEELIVLKAVYDQNLPKLDTQDVIVFKGIAEDVFVNSHIEESRDQRFKAGLLQTIKEKGLQPEDQYISAMLNIEETINNRHGVMVIGQPMVGKTTALRLLQQTHNSIHTEELKRLQKEFLETKVAEKKKIYGDQITEIEIEKANHLNKNEADMIRSSCKTKGVSTFFINPKAQKIDRLMGYIDEEKESWNEGILPYVMRTALMNRSDKRSWIVFDGHLESEWVENLNSLLDDNKKLTLVTGECIGLEKGMNVIMEAQDLKNCSPATISRCGIICINNQMIQIKSLLNQYCNNLPPLLADQAQKFDQLVNYFFPDIIKRYLSDEKQLIYPVTKKYAVQNFLKFLDSCINDYRSSKFKEWKHIQTFQRRIILQADTQRHKEVNKGCHHRDSTKRYSNFMFQDHLDRASNALKYRAAWFESFFIQSLVQSVSSLLKEEFKKDFIQHVFEKVTRSHDPTLFEQMYGQDIKIQMRDAPGSPDKNDNEDEGGDKGLYIVFEDYEHVPYIITETRFTSLKVYQPSAEFLNIREEVRLPTETDLSLEELDFTKDIPSVRGSTTSVNVSQSFHKLPKKSKVTFEEVLEDPIDADHLEESDSSHDRSSGPATEIDDPTFICKPPVECSLLDYYFDIDECDWVHWDLVKHENNYNEPFKDFISTIETTRLSFTIEGLLTSRQNSVLVGESGSGKTWIMRHIINHHMQKIVGGLVMQQIVFYSNSDTAMVQELLERPLEKIRRGLAGPPFGKKMLYFIDDLTMSKKDKYGHSEALELLRHYLNYKMWYSLDNNSPLKIESSQFSGCVTSNPSHPVQLLTGRNEWHWAILGYPCENLHLKAIFKVVSDEYMQKWPVHLREAFGDKIIESTVLLRQEFNKLVKSTASRYVYTFNIRHFYRIFHGLGQVHPRALLGNFHLARLWVSECFRTLVDRYEQKEERKMFNMIMHQIATKTFDLQPEHKFPPKLGRPFFSHLITPNDEVKSYTAEVGKIRILKPLMERKLEDYNLNNPHSKINMSMFDYMIENILKVTRAISQPDSSVILVSLEGLGQQAISRLSICISRYRIVELSHVKEFDQDEWKQSLIDTVLRLSEDEYSTIVFNIMPSDFTDDTILTDLNCLLKNGEISSLLEKEQINQCIVSVRQTIREASVMKNNQVYERFLSRVRRNLKAILNLTPNGDVFQNRIKKYPSIIHCSTMIYMDLWPEEGYLDVGIKELDLDIQNKATIVKQAIGIHGSMLRASQTGSLQFMPMTPIAFINFMRTFKKLYKTRHDSLGELKSKYTSGLNQMKTAENRIEDAQRQLDAKEPQIKMEKERIKDVMKELNQFSVRVNQDMEQVMKEEADLEAQKTEAERIREECDQALKSAGPAVEEAVEALKKLKKTQITEMKSIKVPSKAILTLMKAVCILLGEKPKLIKKEGSYTEKNEDWWTPATSNKVLGNSNLLSLLINMDPNTLNQEIMLQVRETIHVEDFTLKEIKRASKAAPGVYKWVLAIEHYFFVNEETRPKLQALERADEMIASHAVTIQQKRRDLSQLEAKLAKLSQEYEEKSALIVQLDKDIAYCKKQKVRANRLLDNLSGEKQKWIVCNRVVEAKFDTLPGDSLLGAALVIYLSQFTQGLRDKLLQKWLYQIQDGNKLLVTEAFDFNTLFGDSIIIKEWTINKLPSDPFSISNAIIIDQAPIQSVIIDPQYQANMWIKTQFTNNEEAQYGRHGGEIGDGADIQVLSIHHPRFLPLLHACISFGKKCLLENVGESIDRALYPFFDRDMLVQEGSSTLIHLMGELCQVDEHFTIYITTEIAQPRFPPGVAVFTNFINFAVTQEGLEAQLLGVIVAERMAELEKQFTTMKKNALSCIKQLKECEELVLRGLQNDIEVVLFDETLVQNLQKSFETSIEVADSLHVINKSQEALVNARNQFQALAQRATLLFFLVRDLQKLEHVYQFSLNWFMAIFYQELNQAQQTNNAGAEVEESVEKENSIDSEYLNTEVNVEEIMERLTVQLYKKVCLSVFQKDKLTVAFMTALRLMESDYGFRMDSKHLKFFIKGPLEKLDADRAMTQREKDELEFRKQRMSLKSMPTKRKKLMEGCRWITDQQWEGLMVLENLEPFNQPNIVDHMTKNPKDWSQFVQIDPFYHPMPGPYAESGFSEHDTGKLRASKPKKQESVHDDAAEGDIDGIFDVAEELSDEDKKSRDSRTESGNSNSSSDEQQDSPEGRYGGFNDLNESSIDKVELERKKDLKAKILKLIVIRVFRPDLLIQTIKEFIKIFLDESFVSPPDFSFHDIFSASAHDVTNLLIAGHNVDCHSEVMRMRKILSKEQAPLFYLPLGTSNLQKIPRMVVNAARAGHWVLLDNLQFVQKHLPAIQKLLQQMFTYEQQQKVIKAEKEALKQQKLVKLQSGVIDGLEDDVVHEDEVKEQSSITNSDKIVLEMPEYPDFKIQSGFRLFIASVAVDDVPISWLQECNKIVLEPPQKIKENTIKSLNSTPPDYLRGCDELLIPFRQMYFALTFYHAVMNGRDYFQSLGWSRPYQFSQADHHISSMNMLSLLKETRGDVKKIPMRLISYLISQIHYGGKITNYEDNRIAQELIATYLVEDVLVKEPVYNLMGTGEHTTRQYLMPPYGSVYHYAQHCSRFPAIDSPSIFGIHPNAQYAVFIKQGEAVMSRVFELEVLSKSGADLKGLMAQGNEGNLQFKRIRTKLSDIENKLPDLIDTTDLDYKFPVSYNDSIAIMMNSEIKKYNQLIGYIQRQLADIQGGLDGENFLDPEMQSVFEAIMIDKTPSIWILNAYPGSDNLPNFMENLNVRVTYMADVLESKRRKDRQYIFWLPGFFDQSNFFNMLLQHEARRRKLAIDSISLKYTVTDVFMHEATAGELEDEAGCYYIHGLQVQCAQWNKREHYLEDFSPYAKNLEDELPVIKIEAVLHRNLGLFTKPRDPRRPVRSLKTQVSMGVQSLEEIVVQPETLQDEADRQFFMTPMYVSSDRDRLPYVLKGYIGSIPIRVANDTTSAFWIKRSLALFGHKF